MKNKIARKIKAFLNIREKRIKQQARQKYPGFLEELPIDANAIFLEARNGKEIDGNIFYLAKILMTAEKYEGYRLYVSAENSHTAGIIVDKLDRFVNGEGTNKPDIVIVESEEYYRVAATAKYIFCDATLKNFFIKREGQIYLNVWHGTPFKVMGRRVIYEPHAIGNAQKNFVIADYLLYPNEYMRDHMIEDYMIANAGSATIIMGGYPRNTAFFDCSRREEVIAEQGLENKRIYIYMPTLRPELMGQTLKKKLGEMDKGLKDNEVLFAKVHPLAADKVKFSKFNRVKAFPAEYETYEFLNAADCLITDYSSVFYDFAVTGRKIVLFTYDEEEYLSARGLYEPMSGLPFTQVKTVSDTLEAARSPKEYDDNAFLQKYCSLESEHAAEDLCARVILNKASSRIIEERMPSNGKENVFVYAGNLEPGERTNRAMKWLEEADKDFANYYLIFKRSEVKDHKEILLNLPDGVMYFGIAGKDYVTGDQEKDRTLAKKRCFGNMRIDREVYL